MLPALQLMSSSNNGGLCGLCGGYISGLWLAPRVMMLFLVSGILTDILTGIIIGSYHFSVGVA